MINLGFGICITNDEEKVSSRAEGHQFVRENRMKAIRISRPSLLWSKKELNKW